MSQNKYNKEDFEALLYKLREEFELAEAVHNKWNAQNKLRLIKGEKLSKEEELEEVKFRS